MKNTLLNEEYREGQICLYRFKYRSDSKVKENKWRNTIIELI